MDYNHWMYSYIFDREIYIVIDEVIFGRIKALAVIFGKKPIKYFKILNCEIDGKSIGLFIEKADRVCFKNLIVKAINKDIVRSDC